MLDELVKSRKVPFLSFPALAGNPVCLDSYRSSGLRPVPAPDYDPGFTGVTTC